MKKIIPFLILSLSYGISALAQVEGDVTDKTLKSITNATITATDTLTKKVDTTKTDDRGFYYFTGLKPGVYKFEAIAPGFQKATYYFKVNKAPEGANETDDTYFAETLDIVLTRPKSQ
jgi:hypothetical protein